MAKVLVISAHPCTAEQSTTMQLLNQFLKTYQAAHPADQIEQINVFNQPIPMINQSMLASWGQDYDALSKEQQQTLTAWEQYAEQFLASDKIIIANPIWNLTFPASLKHWFDAIMRSGKTFKYTENGPVGLAAGKKVMHLQSNGSVWAGQDLATKYIDDAFKFMGIDDIDHIYIDGKDIPDLTEQAMENALAEAKQKAQTF